MKPLNEKTWRPFRLLDYFDFIKGDQKDMSTLEAGDLPLISAKNSNNGLKAFVADNGKKIFDGHCLTLNNDGDGGAGIAYYQPTKFLLDTHVTALYPKLEMSRETLLFIAQCITTQRDKFGHGYSLSNKRLNVFRVMLPVTEDGTPDYDYMENYIRAVEEEQLQKYRDYLSELPPPDFILPLNKKIWRAFLVGELFVTIRNGVQVPTGAHVSKENLREGKTPRITVTGNNNGVYGFYSSTDKNYKTYENFISVSFLGDCFYHPYEASLDMKVHCLKLLDRELTAPLALFLTRMLKQMTAAFNYGNQISSTDIVNKKIFLPINDAGEPDFEYMENYIKKIEAEQYKKYLDYIG